MEFSQIAETIWPAAQQGQQEAFASARETLQQMISALNEIESLTDGRSVKRRQEAFSSLSDLIDKSSWAELLQIQSALPLTLRGSFGEFRENLKETMTSLAEFTGRGELSSVEVWQQQLRVAQARLDEWEERATKARRRRRYLVTAAGVFLLIGGPTFLTIQYLHGSIEPESVTFMFPIDPSNEQLFLDSDDLKDTDAIYTVPNRESFMREFSRFYFGLPNNLTEHSFEFVRASPPTLQPSGAAMKSSAQPASDKLGRPTVPMDQLMNHSLYRWKFVLQNSSMRRDHFVSEVRETVECLEESSFPWAELNTSPALKVSVDGSRLRVLLKNEGIGPAIRMKWQIQAENGETLNEGRHFLLKSRTVGSTPMLDPMGNWGIAYLLDENGGTDNERDWLKRAVLFPRKGGAVKGGAVKGGAVKGGVVDPASHERVMRLQRLKDLADKVIVGGEVVISLSYEDMKDNNKQMRESLPLPDNVVLFRPRSGASQKGGTAPTPGMALYYALANAFTPPDKTRVPQDTLTGSLELDLKSLEKDMSTSKSLQFDSYLAAQGRIAITSTALRPTNGTYRVTVYVDGENKIQFRLATLVPELRVFPQQDPFKQGTEINWYRKEIGKSSLRLDTFEDSLGGSPQQGVPVEEKGAAPSPAPVFDPSE